MRKYKTLLFLFLFISFYSFAEQKELKNGFKFFDQEIQKTFINYLNDYKVPFVLKEDGYITYPTSYEALVSKIKITVLNKSFKPSIHYEDKLLEKRFIDQLNKEGIVYGIEIRQGESWIFWSEKDEKKVDMIRENIWF